MLGKECQGQSTTYAPGKKKTKKVVFFPVWRQVFPVTMVTKNFQSTLRLYTRWRLDNPELKASLPGVGAEGLTEELSI